MTFSNSFGIDLGTDTVKIFDFSGRRIVKGADLAAVRDHDRIMAVGDPVRKFRNRTPDNIQVISPVSHGRIHDVLMAEVVLHTMLRKCGGYAGLNPTLLFSVPADMTEIERRAYSTIARKGRFRRSRVLMAERPVCDAVSIGVPILTTPGTMIANIGDQSAEVSVIADRRVIISRMIPVGGKDIDRAIVESVRKRNSFIISMETAEQLKLSSANLYSGGNTRSRVAGVDLESGLPLYEVVSSANVSHSAAAVLKSLALEMHQILERIPPQVRSNIVSEGIFLTGGTSRIPGISGYMQSELGMPVNIPESHEYSTVNGLRDIMTRKDLTHWAFAPGKGRR